MIYGQIIVGDDAGKLASGLADFLRSFNIASLQDQTAEILHITQSETGFAWAGTARGFETTHTHWHGTISILYRAKDKL
jgi:hypothetical protein